MLFQEIMRLEPFEGATVLVGDTRGEHQEIKIIKNLMIISKNI